jgi:hypothetical protein
MALKTHHTSLHMCHVFWFWAKEPSWFENEIFPLKLGIKVSIVLSLGLILYL